MDHITSESSYRVDFASSHVVGEDASASASPVRTLHLRNYHPNHAAKHTEKSATRIEDAGLRRALYWADKPSIHGLSTLYDLKDYEFLPEDHYCPLNLPVIYQVIKTKSRRGFEVITIRRRQNNRESKKRGQTTDTDGPRSMV
ncbi:uncharacterized protein A4U43_C04F25710 [Asparagus officinalis]|uniref:Uncharacterized protein n=1 Tax=Asparagus officinalis TaxID=4686 RepID=A0A5P1F5E7_ASPOF|nr:uncharacterized protein A4U43_C04F25710 [Asparagus officinalis]